VRTSEQRRENSHVHGSVAGTNHSAAERFRSADSNQRRSAPPPGGMAARRPSTHAPGPTAQELACARSARSGVVNPPNVVRSCTTRQGAASPALAKASAGIYARGGENQREASASSGPPNSPLHPTRRRMLARRLRRLGRTRYCASCLLHVKAPRRVSGKAVSQASTERRLGSRSNSGHSRRSPRKRRQRCEGTRYPTEAPGSMALGSRSPRAAACNLGVARFLTPCG
jgi:hypothetical protein